MPFGIRKARLDYTASESVEVEIDFNAVWKNVIKGSIPEQIDAKRSDELRKTGQIDKRYIEWIYKANVMIADLTFGNPNVYYELGIRQSISNRGTVLIACKGTRLPFDVRNQYVLEYDLFDATTIRDFTRELHLLILEIIDAYEPSPVHLFLPILTAKKEKKLDYYQVNFEHLGQEIKQEALQTELLISETRLLQKVVEANTVMRLRSLLELFSKLAKPSVNLCERLAIQLRKHGLIDEAIEILYDAHARFPDDFEVLRELGFLLRKKGENFYDLAEMYMRKGLELNDTDGELHGMLGGLLKRQKLYNQALVHYGKAHFLDEVDLYPLVNLGVINAALGKPTQAITWYQKVISRCDELISFGEPDYWTYLCLIEAEVAVASKAKALATLKEIHKMEIPKEDIKSAIEQLNFFVKIDFSNKLATEILQRWI